MDEIRSWLYIGKYRETLDKSYLDFKSIKAMLQLAERVEQKGINTLFLPVQDLGPTSPDLIRRGVDFVLAEKEKGNKILVACGAGINRSTAFCMAALKEAEGLSLWEAFKEIKRRHPESMPHEPVWESFCRYYNESTPYLDVMRLSIQSF
jgi:protein-tyrosine phosphatase